METKTSGIYSDILADINASEIFAIPIGPTTDCLSASQLVRMFESGARSEELRHLLRCRVCKDIYARASQAERMLAIESSASIAEKFGQRLRVLFTGQKTKDTASHVSAVLGMSDPVLEVTNPDDQISVTIDLLPFTSFGAESIDVSTLRLNGAVTSDSPTIQVGDAEYTEPHQLTTVTFEDGKLSKDVKQILANHARVADQIHVTGTLKGGKEDLFLGQAKVHFVQSHKLNS